MSHSFVIISLLSIGKQLLLDNNKNQRGPKLSRYYVYSKLSFMNSFNDHRKNIGCIGKLGQLLGFLRNMPISCHYNH